MLLPAVVWWPCGAVSCGAVRCGVVVPCDGGERLRCSLQITEGSTIIRGGHMSSGLVWSVRLSGWVYCGLEPWVADARERHRSEVSIHRRVARHLVDGEMARRPR